MAIAESAYEIGSESVCGRYINALQIFTAFEEIRVQQIGIQRILFDVLPVSSDFPSMLSRSSATDETKTAAVADGKSNLVRFDVMPLRRETRNGRIIK